VLKGEKMISNLLRCHLKRLSYLFLLTILWIFVIWNYYISYPKPDSQAAHCVNNMRQIAYVCASYSEKYGYLPVYTVDENNKPLHSWRVLILPYIEEEELYKKIRLNEPWNSEYNKQFHDYLIPLYKCRADFKNRRKPVTNYFLLTGKGTTLDNSGKLFVKNFNTEPKKILLVESSKEVHWMCPVDISFDEFKTNTAPSKLHYNFYYNNFTSEINIIPFWQSLSGIDIFLICPLLILLIIILLQTCYLMILFYFYFRVVYRRNLLS
jgi:hypothetical protein